MHSYLLVIPLPSSVRLKLTSLCYGLPKVRWIEEENFHLTLRYLGVLSDHSLMDIQNHLKNLFFLQFPLILKGTGHFHSKGQRGSIWLGVADNPQLSSLKKEVNHVLKGIRLPSEEQFHPHITLGHYAHLSPQKLGDYLFNLNDYQSDSIEIKSCQLVRLLQTPRRTIYEIVEEYPASLPATGED